MKTDQIVAALIRSEDKILLVQQQGPQDAAPSWALPGGVAHPGELLTEALAREVREETGLEIHDLDSLLYLVQVDDPARDRQSFVFVFTVRDWSGRISPADPDNFILDVRFLPVPTALLKLEALPWRSMREPILAHLIGERQPGAVWLYRCRPDGSEAPV